MKAASIQVHPPADGNWACLTCNTMWYGSLEPKCPKCGTQSTPMPHAHALFAEAHKTISGPRRGDYGSAEESFKRIALTWSAVLGVTVTAQQVALCMVGLKICREANGHKHDSLVDICGYTGLLAEMEGGK